ncbi:MAG: N-acetylmuramoyl-L-alanine amidase [Chloroflexota bacterium]
MKRVLVPLLAAAMLVAAMAPAAVLASGQVDSFRVVNSPFTSDAVSTRHKAGVRLTLAGAAHVTLTIETTGGVVVRHLANGVTLAAGSHAWKWAGRNDGGTFVPDGDYVAHLVVTDGFDTLDQALLVRKGMPPIYPFNPGAITVLINPGHGGYTSGAVAKGVTEKFLNLDIGLRLRRLLEAAGVNVVMTRSTDVHVPDPEFDVNGDGVAGPTKPGGDDWDGLAYRIDIGNEARADVHIFNHNNGSSVRGRRGTQTYSGMDRSFTPENLIFATDVQAESIVQLDSFRSATYYPIDGGVKNGRNYYTLRPYSLAVPDPPLEPRPALQPTIMTESLYVSDPIERAILLKGAGREAIAIAMYLGIRDYLATRDYGIRYQLIGGPTDVAAGASADYRVQVTNTGNQASAGWQLQLHSVPAVPFYDGSGAIGDPLGSVNIPDGLAPGQSTTLSVHATAPPTAGAWLVKGDVFIGGSDRPYLSQRGVVAIQVPLTTEP